METKQNKTSKHQLSDLQKKLLEMLVWFDDFCNSHSLRYFAAGGTFLGAVRHHGFIPWDDDIDIVMPRNDYEKLIRLLKDPIEHYCLESPKSAAEDYFFSYAKMFDMNTTLVERQKKRIVRGAYLDIFPLDGLGNTLAESRKNYRAIDRLNMLLAMRLSTYRKNRNWWKNLAALIGELIPVNNKQLSRKLDNLCANLNYDDYRYVANCMSTYRDREIIDKSLIGTPTRYSFEGVSILGPERADEYLAHIYGNWRELPPEEKRQTTHDFEKLDLNKPYRL